MKVCRKCLREKPLSGFSKTGYVNAAGIPSYKQSCKVCRADALRIRYCSDPEYRANVLSGCKRYRDENKESVSTSKKRCYQAKTDQYLANGKRYREENKEAIAARLKGRRLANPKKFKEWADRDYTKNRDAYIRRATEWIKANPEKNKAFRKKCPSSSPLMNRIRAAKRRGVKKCATPQWFDDALVEAVYTEAERLSAETGIPHEVDHVVPLQGRMVSGLHVADNLQIITREENRKKSNAWVV